MGRGDEEKGRGGTTQKKLARFGGQNPAINVKGSVYLLARGKGERPAESAATSQFGMDGGTVAGRARTGNVRRCGPVLHNVGFAHRWPRDAGLRTQIPEGGPQAGVGRNLNAGFNSS